jgi:hypothetical protein
MGARADAEVVVEEEVVEMRTREEREREREILTIKK